MSPQQPQPERPVAPDLPTLARGLLHPQTRAARLPAEDALGRTDIPPEILGDAARRLRVFCILLPVISGLFLLGSETTDWFQLGAGEGKWVQFGSLWATAFAILALKGVFEKRPRLVLDLAVVFQIFIAANIAVMINQVPWPRDIALPSWSPVAVFVLIFGLVIPNTVGRSLIGATLAAAADPIAAVILAAAGVVVLPEWDHVLLRFLPNAAAVPLVIVISRFIYRMGAQLEEVRRMGSYQLDELIGRGGMGEVWRARHRMLSRPAAVKLIRPETLAGDDEEKARVVLARFEREVEAAANLRSPHTIEVYDFGTTADGTFYFVMELLEGLDLRTLVERFGPQRPVRVIHLLRQACHSLYEAHQDGLVHRDIKPANLLACQYGADPDFLKVLDFGLVKQHTTDADDPQITSDGVVAGTPAYMAPELCVGAPDGVDGRADLYALGCVAHWLLTGRLVFESENAVELMVMHARDVPDPVSAHTELEVPRELETIILDCLQKNPADRPATARELSERLAAVELDEPWSTDKAQAWWDTHRPS